jgi:UDP-N-acetyl-D-mannosaminuronic acid dehydrogenase
MSFRKSKVLVVGLGYIGLPTAAVLARAGHDVVGFDVNPRIIEFLNRGEIHIVEKDLDGLVHEVVASGRLRATLAAEEADVIVVAVPTPFKDGHQPDLSYIEQAARSIAPILRPGNLVILESTSPVGTTERMVEWMSAIRPDLVFPGGVTEGQIVNVAYCPERVLPGRIIAELVQNDRVIGGMTAECSARSQEFYKTFVQGECVATDSRTAEMTKLTENAFRDVNIAFANELSLICDRMSVNVWELIRLANRHPRVNILNPGPGVGGHCIAVDPWFIVNAAPDEAQLIRAAREVNDGKPLWVVDKILAALGDFEAGASPITVACLGLTFKANVDDVRESPAVEVVQILSGKTDAHILVVDPFVESLPTSLVDKVELTAIEDALGRAAVVVLLVDHHQFRSVERSVLDGKSIIDTRGFWQ